VSNLEQRVKVLEDLVQRITQAFYAPPTPHTETPKPQGYGTKWEDMKPTDKGAWQKATDLQHLEVIDILKIMDTDNKTVIQTGGYTYWKLVNRESGKLEGLGRRQK
jgi:hypothetical protein